MVAPCLMAMTMFASQVNWIGGRNPRIALANIAEGTHEGAVGKIADAAIGTRYLLGKFGTDDFHVNIAGAADIPFCTMPDEAAVGKRIQCHILGVFQGSLLMVASEAITAGEHVYAAANGKVQDLPAAPGTYWEVGLALTAAGADTDLIEVAHCVPRKVVVAA